ncbi:zinc finger, CCHC-type containing protein [Tanacetum coccineum]|uniref:Zinc finger, CCHC-type containing protein n=1 Tax=Tanacetum coccineum TaxID=301880 RepID=A0ABQ4ZW03_9ASTR
MRIEDSLKVQDSDKPKGYNVDGPSVVNMVAHNKSIRCNENKGKRKNQDTKTDPTKKSKLTCWKCEKLGHLKKDCKGRKVSNKANGVTVHVCKDRYWFKDYESLNDGSILHIGNESTTLVHGRGLSQGFWDEAMLIACYLLNRVPNKKNKITPYELWTKKKPNLNYLMGCREVVKLPNPKLKTLGERGIECIFVGHVEHSKAFRFYVIEPNESVLINSIIESGDAIFDENRFSFVPRPSQRSLTNGTEDIGGLVVPKEVTKEVVVQQPELDLRKNKRNRTPKNFGPEFQLYIIKGTKDEGFIMPDIAFVVGKLSRHPRSNSTMKSEFMALAAAGKEVK